MSLRPNREQAGDTASLRLSLPSSLCVAVRDDVREPLPTIQPLGPA
ncbi:hypothetical protein [Novosphingobium sp. RL4]|nr:hypothetical protein [Novosphingobium sp. RL4]WRT94524.1 hypothetical protein U9J33_08500 [Novosphingobium sp. RL4]